MTNLAPNWSLVRIYGTWLTSSLTAKRAGTWKVEIPARLTNSADDDIIPAGVYASGDLNVLGAVPSLDVQIPATDDPDIEQDGWLPTITVTFTDGAKTEVYRIEVPVATPAQGINLRTVALPAELPQSDPMYRVGAPGGVAQLDEDGLLPEAQVPGRLTEAALSSTYEAVVPVPVATGVQATDVANIAAAITRARALLADGGRPRLSFPACPIVGGSLVRYELGSTHIPILGGVAYEGLRPQIQQDITAIGGYMPDSDFHFVGGTVFHGDGTAPCFWDELTDTATASTATEYSGVSLRNFGFDGFSHGIKIGAQNLMGMTWSTLDGIFARNCGWGIHAENYQHLTVGTIFVAPGADATVTPLGLMRFADHFPDGNWGNSSFAHLMGRAPNGGNTCRGVVFEAAGSGNDGLTIGVIDSLQVNTFNQVPVSQSATLTGGSSAIAVTDGSKFAVGMPVSFGANLGGFNAGITYIVRSVTANLLTLAPSKRGSVTTAGASGTTTITTSGFSAVEFASLSGGNIVGHIGHLDIEGNRTVGAWCEGFKFSRIENGTVEGIAAGYVLRDCDTTRVHSATECVVDADYASGNVQYDGGIAGFPWCALGGLQHNGARQTHSLAIGPLPSNNLGGHLEQRHNQWLYPAYASIGEHQFEYNDTITLGEWHCGHVCTAAAASFTITLPTIVPTDTSKLSGNAGLWFEIWNVSSAGADVTVQTSSGQVFNRTPGKTSTVIHPGQRMRVLAMENNGGWWAAHTTTLSIA